MTAASRVIHKGRHHTACAMRDGSLVVSSNRKQSGKRVFHPGAAERIEAIGTAIDGQEADDLCRAIIRD